jgi:ELWxxDGT repeat protein
MHKIILFFSMFISLAASAQSLAPSTMQAGKSVRAKVVDGSNNDITSQYTLSYSGPELKIITFGGKQVIVGSIVGNWNILATQNSNSSTINLPVTITAGAAAKVSILDGNSQTGVTYSVLPMSLRAKVTDYFGNPVSGSDVRFNVLSGEAVVSLKTVTSDVNGIAATTMSLGALAERSVIKVSLLGTDSAVQFFEYTTYPANQASSMVITSQTHSVNMGGQILVTAKAVDSSGAIASSFSDTVYISGYQNSSCSILSSQYLQAPQQAPSSGMVSFTFQPKTIEPLYIKVESRYTKPACSQLITILPASTGLASLNISQLPTLLKTGQNLFPSIKVQEIDSNGQLLSSATDSISINAYDDSTCSQLSSTQLSNNQIFAIGGYATFPRVQSSSARTIYLKASSGSVSSSCSNALIILAQAGGPSPSPTVTPSSSPSPTVTPSPTATPSNSGANFAVYRYTDSNNNISIKRTDGTATGTYPILSNTDLVNFTTNDPTIIPFASYNSKIYFIAVDFSTGDSVLYGTDGTVAGTVAVKDFSPPFGTSSPTLAVVNGKLMFGIVEGRGNNHSELWSSDGTTAGTVMISTLNVSTQANLQTTITNMVNFLGKLFFTYQDVNYGSALFSSDGTNSGTGLVDGSVNTPQNFQIVNNKLIYYGYGGNGQFKIWATDGTSAGTNVLVDSVTNYNYPIFVGQLNNRVYFTQGSDLWATDGTVSGTGLVKSGLNAQYGGAVFNNKMYFSANDGVSGYELWATDGTSVGTTLVKDINSTFNGTTPNDSLPANFHVFKSKLYFNATTPDVGMELWETDGTAGGTKLTEDINPNPTSPSTFAGYGNPHSIKTINGKMVLMGSDSDDLKSKVFMFDINNGIKSFQRAEPADSGDANDLFPLIEE